MSEEKRNDAEKGKAAGNESGKAPASKPSKTDAAKSDSAGARPRSATASAKPGTSKPASPEPAKPGSGASAGRTDEGRTESSTSGRSAAKTSAAAPAASTSAAGATSGSAGKAGTPPPARARRNGSDGSGRTALLVAVVAIIVAVVAILGAGWLWYRGQHRLASLDSRVATVEQSMQSNVQDVVMPRLSKFDQRLQSLSESNDQQSQRLSDLKQSLAAMKQSVKSAQTQAAELADQISGNSNRWELNQIESLLRAANQRLQLYDDPQGARQALELASDAIGRKGDPRLFKIRSEIVNEIAALRALPDPDIEGLSLELAAMVKRVPDLPLASSVPGAYKQQASDDSNAGTDSGENGMSMADLKADFTQGWDHFKDSVAQALSGMLTIRRANGTQRALLPPDQVFFLNQNLQLQLRTARLALLEHDTQGYRDSLASARKWLGDYYDTDAAPVSNLRDQLEQMSNVKLDWEAPDISRSLTMLRELMSRRAPEDGGSNGSDDKARSGQQAGQDGQ